MSQHYWTVVVRKSHIDADSNILILGEVLEEIQFGIPPDLKKKLEEEIAAKGMVMMPFDFEVISYLGTEQIGKKINLLVEIRLPNGSTVKTSESVLMFEKERMRNRLRLNALPISGSGVSKVKVFQLSGKDKSLLAEIPLLIKIV
jgi:hypothetical protein